MRVLLSLVVALAVASALQFDVDVGRTKCIGEIMSKHDLAKGKYVVLGMSEGAPSGIDVKIVGPNNEAEFSQQNQAGGKFAFTAAEGGSHKVCFANKGQRLQRIELTWAAGVDTNDYEEVAKKEQLKPLELELRKLEDRIESVHREMLYQREREEMHRNTNESTNNRVQWFSILTIIIVLAQAVMQVMYLHNFFKKGKLL